MRKLIGTFINRILLSIENSRLYIKYMSTLSYPLETIKWLKSLYLLFVIQKSSLFTSDASIIVVFIYVDGWSFIMECVNRIYEEKVSRYPRKPLTPHTNALKLSIFNSVNDY
jgi:hypothetical protein